MLAKYIEAIERVCLFQTGLPLYPHLSTAITTKPIFCIFLSPYCSKAYKSVPNFSIL